MHGTGRIFQSIFAKFALFLAGKSSGYFQPSGNLSVNTTTAASSATNVQQTLMTYTVPANTLAIIGQALLITAWGITAGNAAPKNIGIAVGGLTFLCGTETQSGVAWEFQAEYFKTAANAQTGFFTGDVGSTRQTCTVLSDTAVDTAAIGVSVVATDVSAGSGNVTCDGLAVTAFN
jgi:hypothetical protein